MDNTIEEEDYINDELEEPDLLPEDKKFMCNICGNCLKTKTSLKEHMLIHTDLEYLCPECPKAFKTLRFLKCHENQVHVSNPVSCLVCKVLCMNQQTLKRHMRIHLGKLKVCEICQKKFSNITQLNHHIKRDHEDIGVFECVTCKYKAQSKFALEEHVIRRHNPAKTFECLKCPTVLSNEQEYKEHQQTHRNEIADSDLIKKNYKDKPVICEICQKWNRGKWWYDVHMRTHTNERPFKCTYCDKTFISNGALTKHIKMHQGIAEFKCDHCGKSFREKKNLMTHAYQHTGTTPFTCNICDASLTTNSLLNRHLLQHKHKNETVENFPLAQREKIRLRKEIKFSRNKMKYERPSIGVIQIEEVKVERPPKKKKERIANISNSKKLKVNKNVTKKIEHEYEILEIDDFIDTIYDEQGVDEGMVFEDLEVTKEEYEVVNILAMKTNDINCENSQSKDLVQIELPTKSAEVLRKEQRLLNGRKIAESKSIFNTLSNRCLYCRKKFDSKEELSSHILETHVSDRPYECPVCEFRFKVKSKMMRHMKIHSTQKDLECPVCGYECSRSDNMKAHIDMHSQVKKYSCKFCEKSYRALKDANSHMLKCKGKNVEVPSKVIEYLSLEKIRTAPNDIGAIEESPLYRFKCAICLINDNGVLFTNQKDAYAHVKLHNFDPLIHDKKIIKLGEKEERNCPICQIVYSGGIYKHVKENHSKFKHQCPECKVIYNSFVRLKNHVKTEHFNEDCKKNNKKRELTCDVCGMELSAMRQLKVHRSKHFNDTVIKCSHCEKTFESESIFNSHLVKYHDVLKNRK